MNKKEILEKLKTLKIDMNRVVILSGASLVLQNYIPETDDIDISTTKLVYNHLDWQCKIGAFNTEIKYFDVFEIGYNLYNPNQIVVVEGYMCANLRSILDTKVALNREKDKNLIVRLKKDLFLD